VGDGRWPGGATRTDPHDLLNLSDLHDPIDLVAPVTATSEHTPAFTYRIDHAASLVFLLYGTRQPTFEEWREAMDALLKDTAFRSGMAIVSDRRRLTDAPTTEMIQMMAAYEYEHRDRFGECRWAVVTAPDSRAEFGMARMSQAVLEGGRSRIAMRPFTDLDQAVRWATTGEEPAE